MINIPSGSDSELNIGNNPKSQGNFNSGIQLSYPLDPVSKKIIEDIVKSIVSEQTTATTNNAVVVSQVITSGGLTVSPSGGTGVVTISGPAYTMEGTSKLYDDSSSANANYSTPTKIHEIAFPSNMPTATFTTTISITGGSTGSPSQVTHGQIYKNGSAYGTDHQQQPNTTSYYTYNDTLSFTGGDLCQFYMWYTGSFLANQGYNDFGLIGLPTPSFFIPTKNS